MNTPPTCRVSGLRGVLLETPELEASTRFYTDVWGLQPVAPQPDAQRCWFRGRGAEPWVLGLVAGSQRQLLCVRLALPSPGDVDTAFDRLAGAGVALQGPPGPLPGPGGYHGFNLSDPDGRTIELSAQAAANAPAPATAAAAAPQPIRASHLVLNSPNARATTQFYLQHLGFEISDWYEGDAIIFLRCNDDHHCVGIGQGRNSALNHLAFLVDDEAAVRAAADAASRRGALPVWGPGRHGPGGNVFHYFKDPAGFVVEYTAELIQIPPGSAWQAQQWQRTPANANVWGTGGPTPLAIELMSGV